MLLYSHSNPTVRTSLLALSVIYEVYESKIAVNDRTTISYSSLQKHAFAQYTKAVSEIIRSLRANTKNPQKDQKDLLLSCLIFIWIEMMLGNMDTAKWHLDSGIKIINDIATSPTASVERQDPEDIYGALHRSFLRLKFQTTVGLEASPMIGSHHSSEPPYSLDPILAIISRPTDYVRAPIPAKAGTHWKGSNVELTWTLQGRHRQFERLRKADEAISQMPPYIIGEEDRKRSLTFFYIKMSRAVLALITEARSQGPESLQTPRYIEVLDIIENIFFRKTFMQPTSASLDFGVIPPIYFTLRVSDINLSSLFSVSLLHSVCCFISTGPVKRYGHGY
jgi:hypothetical protein